MDLPISFKNFLKFCIYLEGRGIYRDGGKEGRREEGKKEQEGDWLSICWFSPQVPPPAKAGQVESRSLQLHLGLPRGFQKAKNLHHHLLLPMMRQQETGSEAGWLGLQLAL